MNNQQRQKTPAEMLRVEKRHVPADRKDLINISYEETIRLLDHYEIFDLKRGAHFEKLVLTAKYHNNKSTKQ